MGKGFWVKGKIMSEKKREKVFGIREKWVNKNGEGFLGSGESEWKKWERVFGIRAKLVKKAGKGFWDKGKMSEHPVDNHRVLLFQKMYCVGREPSKTMKTLWIALNKQSRSKWRRLIKIWRKWTAWKPNGLQRRAMSIRWRKTSPR